MSYSSTSTVPLGCRARHYGCGGAPAIRGNGDACSCARGGGLYRIFSAALMVLHLVASSSLLRLASGVGGERKRERLAGGWCGGGGRGSLTRQTCTFFAYTLHPHPLTRYGTVAFRRKERRKGEKRKEKKNNKQARETHRHMPVPRAWYRRGRGVPDLRSGADLSFVCETETTTVGVPSIMDSV